MKRKNKGTTLATFLLFLLVISAAVTITMFTYSRVTENGEENITTLVIVMFLVIVFLSAVCTLVDIVRRRLTVDDPVEKILETTEKIAAGDFSVRLNPTHAYGNYNDFDCIIENLNLMAAELGKSEILHSDFISNVSHELKTPLSIIKNYAVALADPNIDEETRKSYCKTLASTADRLSALIGNVLKLNKLENRKLPPEKERFPLHEHLAQSVLGFEELLEQKQIELFCDLEEFTVFSSPSLLEIVWNNLLSNAIKFTKDGGKISVTLKRKENGAIVQVSDTGCGISPETGARIFDKFYQGDTSHASEGNGLGLALVKKVIDTLGGEISVESEQGKGSTFTVVLKEV